MVGGGGGGGGGERKYAPGLMKLTEMRFRSNFNFPNFMFLATAAIL